MALWWRDALADGAILTNHQRDLLSLHNMCYETYAKNKLMRAKAADTTNLPYSKARFRARELAREFWRNVPDGKKADAIEHITGVLKSERLGTVKPKTLWGWLAGDGVREADLIPPHARSPGRPKSNAR